MINYQLKVLLLFVFFFGAPIIGTLINFVFVMSKLSIKERQELTDVVDLVEFCEEQVASSSSSSSIFSRLVS